MAIGTIQDGDVRWLIKDTRSTAIAANPDRNIVGEDGLMSHQDKAKLDKIILNGDIISTYNMPPAGDNLGAVKSGGIFTLRNGVISINHASADGFGDVKIGTNIDVNVGVISVKTTSKTDRGIVQIGDRIDVSNGVISVPEVRMYSGNSAESTNYGPQNSDNGNTYIRIVDGSIASGVQLYGSGFTTVTSSNNKVTISTEYSDMIGAQASAKGRKGLVPEPQANDQDSFLRGNATWYKFKVAHPKQNTRIEYDGNTHTPSWDNYDAAVMDMETVGSNYYSYAGAPASTTLNLVTSATSGKNAGKYVVKFTPKEPYTWIEDNSRNAFYTYWTIEKKPNTINLDRQSASATYLTPVEIYYTTNAYDEYVADKSSISNEEKNRYNTISIKEPELNFTSYPWQDKWRLQYDNIHAYHKTERKIDEDGMPYIEHVRSQRTLAWCLTRNRNSIYWPVITLTSEETTNYKADKKKLSFTINMATRRIEFASVEDQQKTIDSVSKVSILHLVYDYGYHTAATVSNNALECIPLLTYFNRNASVSSNFKGNVAAYDLPGMTNIADGSIYKITAVSGADDQIDYDSNEKELKVGDSVIFAGDQYFSAYTDYDIIYTLPFAEYGIHSIKNNAPSEKQSSVWGNDRAFTYQEEDPYERRRTSTGTYVLIPSISSGSCTIKFALKGKPTIYNIYESNSVTRTATVTIDDTAAKDMAPLANSSSLNYLETILDSGQGRTKYKVGDYISFRFEKDIVLDSGNTIMGTTDHDADDVPIYKAVLIGINHNEGVTVTAPSGSAHTVYSEGIIYGNNDQLAANRQLCGHFCICKDDDNEDMAFDGMKMHNTTNRKGWNYTDLKSWLENTFYNALPANLRNKIKMYRKYTYHSNGSTSPAVGDWYSDGEIWLMSQREIRSNAATNYTYKGEWEACAQYEYYKNGNPQKKVSHDTKNPIFQWTRTHQTNINGMPSYTNANRVILPTQNISAGKNSTPIGGVAPCFVI